MPEQPIVIVLAGPNGVGKSTAATHLISESNPFLNADEIAKALPNYPSTRADLEAGRMLIEHMNELEQTMKSFAVETTLASRTLAPRIARLQSRGYLFRLHFIRSASVEFSQARVASRVRSGGHSIPDETVRRRFYAGLRNFFEIYRPLADLWDVHDNFDLHGFRLIASGGKEMDDTIYLREMFEAMKEISHDE